MAGQVKKMIDKLIQERSGGNPLLASTTKTKLILKGINPDKFTASSPDDPAAMQQIRAMAADMGIRL